MAQNWIKRNIQNTKATVMRVFCLMHEMNIERNKNMTNALLSIWSTTELREKSEEADPLCKFIFR